MALIKLGAKRARACLEGQKILLFRGGISHIGEEKEWCSNGDLLYQGESPQ
jgi:hypothetical protein